MKTLKEEFWKDGNIFEFNDGSKRFIWGNYAMDTHGFIPRDFFNSELVNTDNIVGEYVIRIYAPNMKAGYFKELVETSKERLLWSKSQYIFTEQEIKDKLGIPKEVKLIIVK